MKIWWATIYTWRITFKLSELQIKLQIGRMSLNIFNNAILFTYELICYAHILNHMNDTEYFFSNYLMIYGLLSFCCYANWYHFKLKSISPSGWSWIMNSISPLLIWFITRADCMIAGHWLGLCRHLHRPVPSLTAKHLQPLVKCPTDIPSILRILTIVNNTRQHTGSVDFF